MSLYRNNGRYIYMTDESPKGMKDVLFLAYEGTGPSDMKETVIAPNKLSGWEKAELTNEWRAALGLPTHEPAHEPTPKPIDVRVETHVETVYKYVEVCHRCEMRKLDKRNLSEVLMTVGLTSLATAFVVGLFVRPDITLTVGLIAVYFCKERLMKCVC